MKGIKITDKSIRYEQTKNSIEEIIRKINAINKVKVGYLESCGASSFCTLMEGMGYLKPKEYFKFPTGKGIQMDDAVMVYLNDPRNDFADGNSMDNRRAASYQKAAKELYSVDSYIKWNPLYDDVIKELNKGNGIQLCLKKPDYWIAVIAREDDDLIFMDSWGTRKGLKNGGVYEHLTRKDWDNVQEFMVVYEA